jgi:Holliday junction DNA helicase RuvA
MLAIHTPDRLRRAVSGGDLVALTKVPGIGKKGAERIVLELRDKIGMPTGSASSTTAASVVPDWTAQVRDALVGLGWSSKQADDAVVAVTPGVLSPGSGNGADVSGLLRAALVELGR